jgi:hypothetical protein
MAQQGKHMRVGAPDSLHIIQYNWFCWLTVTGMTLIPTRFLQAVKPYIHFKILPSPNFALF